MENTKKCPHCQKVYFVIKEESWPFCGKKDNNPFDIFSNIFGNQNNPFNNLGDNYGV